VYRAVAATPSPSLDLVLSRLSSAADHSKLWFAVAAALALKPGRPRRAALVGVASIGLASATANLVGKGLLRRARPDRAGLDGPAGRKVKMPGSNVVSLRAFRLGLCLRHGGRRRAAPGLAAAARRGRRHHLLPGPHRRALSG
jgi:hypothetical protein